MTYYKVKYLYKNRIRYKTLKAKSDIEALKNIKMKNLGIPLSAKVIKNRDSNGF